MQNSASVPNLDDASGHKAIKIKNLRNILKLNSMKAKLKQTSTVANYRPATHTSEKCGQKYEIQKPSTCNMRKFIACQVASSCNFDKKRATETKFVAQSRPALYSSKQLPSTCNKGSTNIFVARQVDHARWKTRNIDPKLETKQCCATRWRIL